VESGREVQRGAERWREVQRDADERCRGAEVQRSRGAAEVQQRCRGSEVQRGRGGVVE